MNYFNKCSLIKFMLIGMFSFHQTYFAQFKQDFIVKANNDTVKMKIEYMSPEIGEACTRVNGKKEFLKAKDLKSVFGEGLLYESVSIKKDRWIFMVREFSGDVNVYRRIRSNGDGGNIEHFYFRQKSEPKGEVRTLSEKNLKEINTYSCKPVMDSLLSKKDWSTFLPEMLKNYNTRCAEIKGLN